MTSRQGGAPLPCTDQATRASLLVLCCLPDTDDTSVFFTAKKKKKKRPRQKCRMANRVESSRRGGTKKEKNFNSNPAPLSNGEVLPSQPQIRGPKRK